MSTAVGQQLYDFAAQLYPICRSITGDGVRDTLRRVGTRVPMTMQEVPSGTRVFDWEVPLEWNIEDASISDGDGRRVVDFRAHNLHLVSYSEPMNAVLSLKDLETHLHSMPDHADWIPYRTSYYRRNWGFCLGHRQRESLTAGKFRVQIKSSLEPGALTYAEVVVPGRVRDEVVFFTHVCHPSLANDNTSGIAIATALAQWIIEQPRRYTYRFVYMPGTIGSLCWLKRNEKRLARVRYGLVLALLGDPGPLTYKLSRRGDAEIDAVASYVLPTVDAAASVIPFSPYGYDERQLCSPGFNLPVGRLTRSVNGGYSQYHSSADDLSLISAASLQQSLETCQRIVSVIEGDGQFRNLSPKGEPLLGKRGLYGAVGGRSPAEREQALLWVLNQSDGSKSLLEIAQRSAIGFDAIREAATALESADLLAPVRRHSGARARTGRITRRTTGASKVPNRGGKS